MTPQVRVIGYTKFLGVPAEVFPDDIVAREYLIQNQDFGSEGARLIECAGRECYDSYGKGRNSVDYHGHIKEVGHGSVLEHVVINFRIWNVSRGLTHELVRHRAGTAISQRSTRYVDENESEWCWHPLFEQHLGCSAMAEAELTKYQAAKAYKMIASLIENRLVNRGISKATARKQARGAARGLLGNALETSLIWSANIRALRNVIEQRASEHADAEIRLLANALLGAAEMVCPEYFSDYERINCADGIGFAVSTPHRKM